MDIDLAPGEVREERPAFSFDFLTVQDLMEIQVTLPGCEESGRIVGGAQSIIFLDKNLKIGNNHVYSFQSALPPERVLRSGGF